MPASAAAGAAWNRTWACSTPGSKRRFRRSHEPCSAKTAVRMSLMAGELAGAEGFALPSEAGFSLSRYLQQVERIDTMPPSGRVIRTVGLLIESQGPRVSVGATCDVIGREG